MPLDMTLKRSLKIILTMFSFVLFFTFCLAGLAFAGNESLPSGIYLNEGGSIYWPCGIPFEEPGYMAVDADGEDISQYVEIEGEVLCWKAGSYVLTYNLSEDSGHVQQLSRTVNVVPVFLPETIVRDKTIYLTFDDGPCQYTEKVLETLDKYDAKASFFVICNGDDPYFYLVSDILEKGHALGIHCSDHEYSRLYSSERYFFEDLMKAQKLLYEETGSYATLFRFPGGSDTAYHMLGRKTEGGFDVIKQQLYDMGMRFYDWNVKTEGTGVSGESMMYAFMHQVSAAEIPISLQHDTRLYSVNMLERFLEWGVVNGYTFAAIDTSTPEIHARVG